MSKPPHPVLVVPSINRDTTFTVDVLPLPGETILSPTQFQMLGEKGVRTAVTTSKEDVPASFLEHVPEKNVYNLLETTGSGDCLIGFVCAGRVAQIPFLAALQKAVVASGIYIGHDVDGESYGIGPLQTPD